MYEKEKASEREAEGGHEIEMDKKRESEMEGER